ncbi:MAG: MlaD family protein [Hyphomonadaceae bacterium]
METRANYVLIGAFVLMAAAAAMLFTVWITRAPFDRDFNTYDVIFEGPVNGLSEGGEVRFNGIKVGEVHRLTLDRQNPNRVIARIRVNSETPVRTDSVAQLDFLGITGVTFIQIRAGTPTNPILKDEPGKPPPVIRTERTALDTLFQGGQDVLTTSSETMSKLNGVLSDENVASLTGILANLDKATAKIARDRGTVDAVTDALRSTQRAADALAEAAVSVDAAAKTIDRELTRLGENSDAAFVDLKPAIKDARDALSSFNQTMDEVNGSLAPAAGRAVEQLALAANDLRTLILRVERFASDVENDPSQFVYRQPVPVE